MEQPSSRPREAASSPAAAAVEGPGAIHAPAAGRPHLPTQSLPPAKAQSSPGLAIAINESVKNAPLPKQTGAASVKETQASGDVTDLRTIRGISNKHRAFLLKAGFTTTSEILFTPLRPLSDRLKLSEAECRDLIQAIVAQRKERWITSGISESVAEQLRALKMAGAGKDELAQAGRISVPPTLHFGGEGFRDLLGGGFVPGTLSEVAGEACVTSHTKLASFVPTNVGRFGITRSSGKTAFSLQLSLRVQLDLQEGGLAGSCAYLSSEGNFPSTRLRDMAFKLSDGTAAGIRTFMDNVHLVHCPEVDALLHVVRYSLPAMVEQSQSTYIPPSGGKKTFSKPVKLVVVDSIAAPFRGAEADSGKTSATEADINKSANTSLAERNAALQEISFRLRKVARQYSIVVLFVNQVSDVFYHNNDRFAESQAHSSSQAGGGSSVTHENGGIPVDYRNYKHASKFFTGEEADSRNPKIAVFGLTWSNCIDVRIMLSRTGKRRRKEDGTEIGPQVILRDDQGMEIEDPLYALETEEIRRATVIFSPFVDKGYVDYALRQEGLVSIAQYHPTPRALPQLQKKRIDSIHSSKHRAETEGSMANKDNFDDSDDEEEALWADMPIDEATLSQL